MIRDNCCRQFVPSIRRAFMFLFTLSFMLSTIVHATSKQIQPPQISRHDDCFFRRHHHRWNLKWDDYGGTVAYIPKILLQIRSGNIDKVRNQSELSKHENDDDNNNDENGKARIVPSMIGSTVTGSSSHDNNNNNVTDMDNTYQFTILSDTILYKNWRTLINRTIQVQPTNQIIYYEIVGQKNEQYDHAVLIFCWNTTSKTITMITEYMPSVHQIMYSLAAGTVEIDKHSNSSGNISSDYDDIPFIAAQHELEEECHLVGGNWYKLTPSSGVVMDKYTCTRLHVYLVLDAHSISPETAATSSYNNIDNNDETNYNHSLDSATTMLNTTLIPKQRDKEEVGMTIHSRMTINELRTLIHSANKLTAVGSWACLLAMEKLREMNEIS